MLIGLLILAFNLRPTAGAIGPLLDQITTALGMSGAVAGLLTTLPVLCFAGFGAISPTVAAKIGLHRAIGAGLLAIVAGQLLRATTSSVVVFMIATTVALAGMATANVLMPSLVKVHFSHRVGLVTALYSTFLTIGLTTASILSVPIAHAFTSWRMGLGAWMITAAIGLLPWALLIRHDRSAAIRRAEAQQLAPRRLRLADVAHTRLGWGLAVFFGLQSMHAYAIFGWLATMYQDAGFSESASGIYLGIATGAGIVPAFLFPAYTARNPRPVGLIIFISICLFTGYFGLLLSPTTLPWLWAALIAVGTSCFPVILALFALRTRTGEGTAALSGFTQSTGYLLAAPGPFLVGFLHHLTGGWLVPKIFLIVMAIPLLIMALLASRPRYLEDELAELKRVDQP